MLHNSDRAGEQGTKQRQVHYARSEKMTDENAHSSHKSASGRCSRSYATLASAALRLSNLDDDATVARNLKQAQLRHSFF
ncbi:uncharacterized protein PG986_014792 [Apiospora aurea]|uniref:Uncharacterized protein n=1 Tax=Apiospora aurea TaxID=335848 RepID=A0ABR1PU10_9PEZI